MLLSIEFKSDLFSGQSSNRTYFVFFNIIIVNFSMICIVKLPPKKRNNVFKYRINMYFELSLLNCSHEVRDCQITQNVQVMSPKLDTHYILLIYYVRIMVGFCLLSGS